MDLREVKFEMKNGKNSGVDNIVLYLGEGVNARIKKEIKRNKVCKSKKSRKAKKWNRRKTKGETNNIVEIEIFRVENEIERYKVVIKIESYEFIFEIEKGLNFITIGEYRRSILANASKPENTIWKYNIFGENDIYSLLGFLYWQIRLEGYIIYTKYKNWIY